VLEARIRRTLVVTLTNHGSGLEVVESAYRYRIIPKDSYESQKEHPLGTGPFKLFTTTILSRWVDVEAFTEYLGTAPSKIPTVIRVRVISDMNALQAELGAGRVGHAPMPTSLSPDAVKLLEKKSIAPGESV
jgi:ABC-type transport system substrate-binding protein